MNVKYNVITGFLYNEIVLYPNELKGERTGIKTAKYSSMSFCNRQNKNPVERNTCSRYYIEYDDDEQHPATGRRTQSNTTDHVYGGVRLLYMSTSQSSGCEVLVTKEFLIKIEYMFTIRKEFSFDASHKLNFLPKEHPCTRLHGHTYTVVIELWSKGLTEAGFVRDYNDLKPIKDWIDEKMDHRHLNEVLPIPNPSAELIAKYIFDTWWPKIRELHAVEVKETPKTSARYVPNIQQLPLL